MEDGMASSRRIQYKPGTRKYMSLAVQLGKRKSLHQLPGMMSLCFFFFYFLKTKKWVRKSVAISLSLFFDGFYRWKKKEEEGCMPHPAADCKGRVGHTMAKKSGRQLPPRASSSPFHNNTTWSLDLSNQNWPGLFSLLFPISLPVKMSSPFVKVSFKRHFFVGGENQRSFLREFSG